MMHLLVASLVAMAIVSSSGAEAAERYVDPVFGVSFELPPKGGETPVGFGNEIASLRTAGGGRIRIVWRTGASRSQRSAQREEPSVARFFQPVEGGVIEVSCRAAPPKFLETFFECRRLTETIRREPVADVASLPDATRLIVREARYALQDGRSGCPDAGLRPRRAAQLARQRGDAAAAAELASLAEKLERKGNGAAGREEERRRDPFFSRLVAARLFLEQGEAARAERILPPEAGGSRWFLAIRMWIARLKGDDSAVRSLAGEWDGEFCGESGALAAHELGSVIGEEAPDRALALFEAAIAADPAFVSAYVSWARLSLDRGGETEEVKGRLCALLARAPATAEIRRLQQDLESLHKSGSGLQNCK